MHARMDGLPRKRPEGLDVRQVKSGMSLFVRCTFLPRDLSPFLASLGKTNRNRLLFACYFFTRASASLVSPSFSRASLFQLYPKPFSHIWPLIALLTPLPF